MTKIKITISKSRCRDNLVREGDIFVVDQVCPPICHELWNNIYPYLFALQNGADLDYGKERRKCFRVKCPDEGRVEIFAEAIED